MKLNSAVILFLVSQLIFFSPDLCADSASARAAANRGDFKTAFNEWSVLAEKGDAEAQYFLGRMYARGDGVPRDFSLAKKNFEMAASQGHALACQKLGTMYEKGDGVAKDPREALRLYQESLRLGNAEAKSFINRISKQSGLKISADEAPTIAPELVDWGKVLEDRRAIN